MMNENG